MTNKTTVKLSWSKREKDWIFDFPDWLGRGLSGPFFDMTKTTGHRTDWERDLKTMLTDHGYDYKTFKITVEKLKDKE